MRKEGGKGRNGGEGRMEGGPGRGTTRASHSIIPRPRLIFRSGDNMLNPGVSGEATRRLITGVEGVLVRL